jgi:hypothetical protein
MNDVYTTTVQDTILPDELKKTFQQFVDQKNVPNLLLTGRAGIGIRRQLQRRC